MNVACLDLNLQPSKSGDYSQRGREGWIGNQTRKLAFLFVTNRRVAFCSMIGHCAARAPAGVNENGHGSLVEHSAQSPCQVFVRSRQRPLHHGLADGGGENAVLRQPIERRGSIQRRPQNRQVGKDSCVITNARRTQSSDQNLFFEPCASKLDSLPPRAHRAASARNCAVAADPYPMG